MAATELSESLIIALGVHESFRSSVEADGASVIFAFGETPGSLGPKIMFFNSAKRPSINDGFIVDASTGEILTPSKVRLPKAIVKKLQTWILDNAKTLDDVWLRAVSSGNGEEYTLEEVVSRLTKTA